MRIAELELDHRPLDFYRLVFSIGRCERMMRVQANTGDEHCNGANGVMQRWGVEWGGAGQLGGQNINRYTLKAGDHVIITGNPGRNPEEHRIRMVGLKRPSDGLSWGGRPGETFD